MRESFERELRESLYIHRPLPLHREEELEAGFSRKKVLSRKVLYDDKTRVCEPSASGVQSLAECNGVITVKASLRSDHWPEGSAADGDYSNFGTAAVYFKFEPQDWRKYHRIHFQVRPRLCNARVAHVNAGVRNEGERTIPDRYFREGATVFDLKNGEWNDCIWEFAAMPRDAVTELSVYVFLSGHDVAGDPDLVYEFRQFVLEEINKPEHEYGWQRQDSEIMFSTVGYWTNGKKTAVVCNTDGGFELVDADTGETVFQDRVLPVHNEKGSFGILDFSAFCGQGEYFLRTEKSQTRTFSISDDLSKESLWKILNFIYCERCGTPVPGKHGTCHQDVTARHGGVTVSFSGGWHDAGDVSQQALQMAETVHALFENAVASRQDEMLYLRLMEEAQWGLDFILKTRFGDGYRASSAGATRFTDNLTGNFDDIEARVHDHSFENFVFSGVEAYAAWCLTDYDSELSAGVLKAAKEDYDFAECKFAKTGVDPAHMFEHSYNSGASQYYAAASWAASCLYQVSGEMKFAAAARSWTKRLLLCQEQGDKAPLRGFFYRDESKKTIVHFNHQSREQQFMQALEAVCRTQPEAEELKEWERGMELYGEYLKAVADYTSPFGMLPAGIHKMDEAEDAETFRYLHVSCKYEDERENYKKQLKAGHLLDENYVLRCFPVWFSFRGNSAVMLAMGKAAAIAGRYFKDEELMELAREQLYWMWGKNPFGQSLIYGVGSNYCRQYAVLCGECVGEVPVGIETLENGDEPYWPQNNNATFREVWIGAASRLLWVLSETV
ncbi:MAG: glycoside hydrolase family 9 protein [Lachnospiraceae bacterium]|nr:glycoside hydrolase family 9 protein [Lachnospiraceae bacterium]